MSGPNGTIGFDPQPYVLLWLFFVIYLENAPVASSMPEVFAFQGNGLIETPSREPHGTNKHMLFSRLARKNSGGGCLSCQAFLPPERLK